MGILTDLTDSWKEPLLIVKPETLIRWHRQSFRVFWKWKSRSTPGRPAILQAQINLIRQMANDNPLWGAPRIHGEMLKLGFDISEATVQRYMPRRPQRTTRRRWKTFLKNHSAQIISVDYLAVPIITFAKINPRWSIHTAQLTTLGEERVSIVYCIFRLTIAYTPLTSVNWFVGDTLFAALTTFEHVVEFELRDLWSRG